MNKVKRNGNATKKTKGEFFVMKSFVDQDACIACGLCVSTCEDVYHFNEEGKAEAVEGIIPAEYEDNCRTAAENCPTMVIEVDEG